PGSGSDLASLKTKAERQGDKYIVNGQKTWTTLGQYGDWMFNLVRTSSEGKPQTGISFLLLDMKSPGVTVRPIKLLDGGHEVNEVFFENVEVPAENLIGEEGQGFKYILDGLNAERTLIAAECIGDGYWFIDRVTKYVNERVVFGRPIGQNQGVAHPLARAWANLEAADLMMLKAATLYDAGEPCGIEANAAKYLAAEAAHDACQNAVLTLGGMGYAKEYHVERLLRESYIPRIAPVSPQMILNFIAEKALGLPKSY
ncbi:acyl-CoA dehydrogenase family protein, partial [Pseudomonas aeruginosa]|uniref:acyl-CoA dehydrogenase family protein n=1 Tax=Pseudomonas aeruginosa TaxID=287 RepID=UPI00094729FD